MSPRTAVQNREIQDITRAKIVESALEMFGQHGYESATVKQIAQYAGISQGLMYHYFASKEALLEAVFQRCLEPLQQIMTGVEEITAPDEKVAAVMRQSFATVRSDQTAARLFYTLRSQMAYLDVLRDETIRWVNALREIFEDCFRRMGHAQPEVDAALFYALLEGMIRHYLLEPEAFPIDAAVERAIEMFCGKEQSL